MDCVVSVELVWCPVDTLKPTTQVPKRHPISTSRLISTLEVGVPLVHPVQRQH